MNRLSNISSNISFLFFIFLPVIMAFATFYEKSYGTTSAIQNIYGTNWFIVCWGILSVFGLLHLIYRKIYKKTLVFLLHISLILILAGALITHFSSQNGIVHLRDNASTHYFYDDNEQEMPLPFDLTLINFGIDYYPGTESPADYRSLVKISDRKNKKSFEANISMNNILKHQGYRFYQSSFDEDMKGSILSVSRDIYGIPVTYAGYFMLFIVMISILLNKNSQFRILLKNLVQKKEALLLIFCLTAFSAQSSTLSNDKLTINKEQSEALGKIWIMYEGRICPLQTFARDFATKLTGKPKYKYANAEQVLAGFLFFPQQWMYVNLFKIENEEILRLTGGKKEASYADFFTKDHQYKLAPFYKEMYQQGKQSVFIKEAVKLDEKIQLINMLQSGSLLKLFPAKTGNRIQWLSPTGILPDDIPEKDKLFIRGFIPLYYDALLKNEAEESLSLLDKLENYQFSRGKETIPSETHRKIELLYNQSNIFSWLFKICLTLGLCALILFILQTIKGKKNPKTTAVFTVFLLIIFIIHTLGLICRGYISGRLPVGNGFETMLFIAWCSMIVAMFLRKYSPVIISFGFLISGFTLLVAHLGMMNPKITPLMPVLSSPLLSIHVSLIMFSYALTGFMVFNALSSFIILSVSKKENIPTISHSLEKLKNLSEIFLYPTTFFMAAGIFIGAIWANISWGRYWGWDPKEVWALITFMLMSLAFHSKTWKIFSDVFFFNLYILIIFVSVLMTYFGVNYFLGGMHSYAGNANTNYNLFIILSIFGVSILLIYFAYRKYKNKK